MGHPEKVVGPCEHLLRWSQYCVGISRCREFDDDILVLENGFDRREVRTVIADRFEIGVGFQIKS